MGIGSLIGAMLVVAKVRTSPSSKTMVASALIISTLLGTMYFIRSYFLAMLVVGGIGFFNIIFMNTVNSTLQLNSSDEYRGRIMSVYTLALGGTTPIGNLFAGGFTEQFGSAVGFLMCGVVTGLLIVVIIAQTRSKERRQEI